MKKVVLFILALLCVLGATAKPKKYIYLWDVTLSMKGYKGQYPDIYDKVVQFLIEDIKAKDIDPESKIIVCPFQADKTVLGTWEYRITTDGKEKLVQKIEQYNNEEVTNTDIVSAIRYAKNNLVDTTNYCNYITILTDGSQSPKLGGTPALINEIRDWKKFAIGKDAFAIYLMLTREAENEEIKNESDPDKGIWIGKATPGDMRPLMLTPNDIRANIKDDKQIELTFEPDTKKPIEKTILVSITFNDTIGIMSKTSFKELPIEFASNSTKGIITLPLEFNETYEKLKNILPVDQPTIIPISIELLNADKLAPLIVNLTTNNVSLHLINKPEKKLTIRLKR